MASKTMKFDWYHFVNQYGVHCPCKISDPESMADILSKTCPCDEFMDEGKCICGLFKEVKEDE